MNQLVKFKIAAGIFLIVISFAVFAWRSLTTEADFPLMQTQDSGRITQAAASLNPSDAAIVPDEGDKQQQLLVDVSGAVRKPGVVRVNSGSRVFEAVDQAGGVSEDADLRTINLAAVVRDGQKIYIPRVGERMLESTENNWSPNEKDKLDLNSASASSLEELDGIGVKTAEKIIAYREEHGGFRNVEELMQVSGIGAKTFEGLKDKITVYE